MLRERHGAADLTSSTCSRVHGLRQSCTALLRSVHHSYRADHVSISVAKDDSGSGSDNDMSLELEEEGLRTTSIGKGMLHDDRDDFPSAPPLFGSAQAIKQDSQGAPQSHVLNVSESVTRNDHNSSQRKAENKSFYPFLRTSTATEEADVHSASVSVRFPSFHASALGPWHTVIAYDACVRLCLYSWSRGCMEAPSFLDNECAVLRDAFGLRKVLLQSEEEILDNHFSPELISVGAAAKPTKTIGKMKVQVRKVIMSLDPPAGCGISSFQAPMKKIETIRNRLSNLQSTFSSGWQAVRKVPFVPATHTGSSFSSQSLAYVRATTRYVKQVSGLVKIGVKTLHNSSSYEVVQETCTCLLRLKSSSKEDSVCLHPGSRETHVFFPDSLGDNLTVEVEDSKGKLFGCALAQVATISEDPGDQLRWWSIYREPEHELVGKIQLYTSYLTSLDENNHLKCGSVAETLAYDMVMEVAMKIQHFQQRNLVISGPWKWLLKEFTSYYGISDVYSNLRYASYVMEVATPTSDCLNLMYELLQPVVSSHSKSTLSHQENRIFGEIKDQMEQIFSLVFENSKSLDEESLSGIKDVFSPPTGVAAPALEPAIRLYILLHDILSPEAQTQLCQYFQTAARMRSKRYLAETDEYLTNNYEGLVMDAVTMCTVYKKMKSLCLNIGNEILTDLEIHSQHILPSFLELPNLSASIYCTELCNRFRQLLIACTPTGLSLPVAELVISTSELQRDLARWKISPGKCGVDAKELFHLYIMAWIQDKRLSLLESCKLDKVKWSSIRNPHTTTPFIDEMYDRLKDMLNEYEVIICRWPEYIFPLENAIADVEKAIVEALDMQYADVLAPLKKTSVPLKLSLKYVQKLSRRSVCPYIVPDELGILLNSMKRMQDVLRPKIDSHVKSLGSCIPDGGKVAPGERLSEITVMLRTKVRNYLQAIVEKLFKNSKLQSNTNLKKILKDSKNNEVESDLRNRIQPLQYQIRSTIDHLHTVFGNQVFLAVCRGYWDRMGQDVLEVLENKRDNVLWYKSSRVAASVLDDTFASQMQHLLGNFVKEKDDLEPPQTLMEYVLFYAKMVPTPTTVHTTTKPICQL